MEPYYPTNELNESCVAKYWFSARVLSLVRCVNPKMITDMLIISRLNKLQVASDWSGKKKVIAIRVFAVRCDWLTLAFFFSSSPFVTDVALVIRYYVLRVGMRLYRILVKLCATLGPPGNAFNRTEIRVHPVNPVLASYVSTFESSKSSLLCNFRIPRFTKSLADDLILRNIYVPLVVRPPITCFPHILHIITRTAR